MRNLIKRYDPGSVGKRISAVAFALAAIVFFAGIFYTSFVYVGVPLFILAVVVSRNSGPPPRAHARRESVYDIDNDMIDDGDRRGPGLKAPGFLGTALTATLGFAAGLSQRRTAGRSVLATA